MFEMVLSYIAVLVLAASGIVALVKQRTAMNFILLTDRSIRRIMNTVLSHKAKCFIKV